MVWTSTLSIDCKATRLHYRRGSHGDLLSSFTSSQKSLALNMFFENGEQAKKVMEPKDDQVRAFVEHCPDLSHLSNPFLSILVIEWGQFQQTSGHCERRIRSGSKAQSSLRRR